VHYRVAVLLFGRDAWDRILTRAAHLDPDFIHELFCSRSLGQ
jgi:hypothetical protein